MQQTERPLGLMQGFGREELLLGTRKRPYSPAAYSTRRRLSMGVPVHVK